jgi:4-carboxymuconolactone decarboxylase
MTAEQTQAAEAVASGPRGSLIGPFAVLVRSPDLMDRVQRLGERIRFGSPLSDRLREWAVVVTAARWRQPYEWSVHAPLAVEAGIGQELVDALAAGQKPEDMKPDEAVVYDFCRQLNLEGSVSDAMFADASALLGETGVVELTTLVGYYVLLAMVLNVAGTPAKAGFDSPF